MDKILETTIFTLNIIEMQYETYLTFCIYPYLGRFDTT